MKWFLYFALGLLLLASQVRGQSVTDDWLDLQRQKAQARADQWNLGAPQQDSLLSVAQWRNLYIQSGGGDYLGRIHLSPYNWIKPGKPGFLLFSMLFVFCAYTGAAAAGFIGLGTRNPKELLSLAWRMFAVI